jgi:hypothetical protein
LAHLHLKNPAEKAKIIELLLSRNSDITIDDLSKNDNYTEITKFPQRIGDLIILPKLGHYLADERGMVRYQNNSAKFKTDVFGEHGFSPRFQEMWGIFYAKGSKIRAGFQIEPFKNIHIYPLICQLLGIPVPPGIDGKVEVLAPVLK